MKEKNRKRAIIEKEIRAKLEAEVEAKIEAELKKRVRSAISAISFLGKALSIDTHTK